MASPLCKPNSVKVRCSSCNPSSGPFLSTENRTSSKMDKMTFLELLPPRTTRRGSARDPCPCGAHKVWNLPRAKGFFHSSVRCTFSQSNELTASRGRFKAQHSRHGTHDVRSVQGLKALGFSQLLHSFNTPTPSRLGQLMDCAGRPRACRQTAKAFIKLFADKGPGQGGFCPSCGTGPS